MKNRYYKYPILLATVSVALGVVLFGFNTAFGVGTPSQTPEKSDTVSPTFSGLNVTGDANFDKNVYVTGDSTFSGKVETKGNLNVTGQLSTGQNWFSSSYIKNFIAIGKGINGSTSNGRIDLRTEGDMTADFGSGAISVGYDKKGLGIDRNEILTTGDKLYLNLDTGNDVVVGSSSKPSNLEVNGGLAVTGATKFSDLSVPSTGGGIKNDEGNKILDTGWTSKFGDYSALNSGYAWTGNEPTSLVSGANGVFVTTGGNGNAYTTEIAKIDTSGNLSVSGHVTAKNGFGKYLPRRESSAVAIAPGKWGQVSVACDPTKGEVLISCSANTYANSGWTDANDVTLTQVLTGSQSKKCWAAGINNAATTRYIRAFAICMNPNL